MVEAVTPWWKVIWVFVMLGECLGIVPAREHVELPQIVRSPARISMALADGSVTISVRAADGKVTEIEILPRSFAGCGREPCPTCPDGETPVPDLGAVRGALLELKERPDLARVREIMITASEETLYRDVDSLLQVSRWRGEVPAEATTPCEVLAASVGESPLFPEVVFAVSERERALPIQANYHKAGSDPRSLGLRPWRRRR